MSKPSTKEKILNGALEILEKQGIRGFSQQAVAKLVGISQGQLTYHFQKRSDLVMALTESALEKIADYLWEKHPNIASKSFDKLMDLVMLQMRSKPRVRALLGLIVEADENEELRKQLIDQAVKVRTLIATALKLEKDEPEVALAHATMLGFSLMMFVQNDKKELEKLQAHFQKSTDLLLEHLKRRRDAENVH